MSQPKDQDYYAARAAAARNLAQRAATPEIAVIHAEFATRYELLSMSDGSGHLAQPAMQVIPVESGNLDQL